jgi:hypothetical protein
VRPYPIIAIVGRSADLDCRSRLRHTVISARGKEAKTGIDLEEGAVVMASDAKMDQDPSLVELKEFKENFKVT